MFGSRHACKNAGIVSINPENGELEIKTALLFPANAGVYNISSDSENVYLGFNGIGKAIDTSTVHAGGVVAYGFESEVFEWTRYISGTRRMRTLGAGRGTVVVDGGGFSKRYYLLDSANGEVIDTLEKDIELGYVPYAFWLAYLNNSEGLSRTFVRKDIDFWRERLVDVEQPPILLDTKIVVRTNVGTEMGQVKIIDRVSGEILWETETNVISNVAVNDSTAFFLTYSAELVAININSGMHLGTIKFSERQIQNREDQPFWVAANNEDVYLYFGDSRQLMALQLLIDGQE